MLIRVRAVCPLSAMMGLMPNSWVGLPEVQLVCQHADAARLMYFELEFFFKVCLGQLLVWCHVLHNEAYHEPSLRKKKLAHVSEVAFG